MKLNIKSTGVAHVWHIRVQIYGWHTRKRRVARRVIATSKGEAVNILASILPNPRYAVVTRCVEGKAV